MGAKKRPHESITHLGVSSFVFFNFSYFNVLSYTTCDGIFFRSENLNFFNWYPLILQILDTGITFFLFSFLLS